jgi:hypothetical protein
MKKFLILLLCLISVSAEAKVKAKAEHEGGSNTSGGGGGVICTDQLGVEEIQVLDYYEAFIKYGVDTDTGQVQQQQQSQEPAYLASLSNEQKFLKTMRMYLTFLPELQENISKFLDRVGDWSEWQNAKLQEYNDSGRKYVLKPNCRYVQLAVRDGDNIRADLELIQKMAPDQRAILMLHEALYFAVKSNRPQTADSTVVRDMISRILTMATMSEFDISRKFDASTLSEKEFDSLGKIDYFNMYEVTELCKVAETVGLCSVNQKGSSALNTFRYDRFFEGYYSDQISTLKKAIDKLELPKKDVKVIYSSKKLAEDALASYQSDLSLSVSRVFTMPMVLGALNEQVKVLEGMQCDLFETADFLSANLDDSVLSADPGLQKICSITKNSILKTLDRIKSGYQREFWFKVKERSYKLSSFTIPPVNLSEMNKDVFLIDKMSVRQRLLIEKLLNLIEVSKP